MSITTVRNAEGRQFAVRIVRTGDAYGRNNVLTHDKDKPLVEFYDLSYPDKFGPDGQFVSRYYADDLLAGPHRGLAMDFGIPAWSLDADSFGKVRNWVKEVL